MQNNNNTPVEQINKDQLIRDTRSVGKRIASSFYTPATFRKFLIGVILFQFYMPALWPVFVVILWVLVMAFQDKKFFMPLRMPKDVGGIDRTDYTDEIKQESFLFGLFKNTREIRNFTLAAGILYLGYMRSLDMKDIGRECWVTNSDSRTHLSLGSTTGGGKTETLSGMGYNALCWGSGYCFSDGKASNNLPFEHWSLTRRLGREDDILVLNFLLGGQDPFDKIVAAENKQLNSEPINEQSNSLNPFADGSSDFLIQLITSLMPKATGDGQQWQKAAIAMMAAIVRTLCYKRAKGEVELSVRLIKDSMPLHRLVEFYKEGLAGIIPELAFEPLRNYFEMGLPGFNLSLVDKPEEWEPDVFTQHGFLSRQFSDVLSMMSDTYGFVFEDQFPEIDMQDVLLNNRILIVLIPTMDKSPQEAAALGKLFVTAVRLMMAKNLGYQIEGYSTLLDVKPTNSPHPYIIFMDEIGYYFAEGIAVMFAQARSLGFMMVTAFQDLQALKRSEGANEYASMIANTKLKWVLALEDPEDTFEMIRKAAGTTYYSMLAGHDAVSSSFNNSYKAQYTTNLYEKDRIDIREVKKLEKGQGVLVFKDSVIPTQSFYIPPEKKITVELQARINRFLQIERPSLNRMPKSMRRMNEAELTSESVVYSQFSHGEKPYYHDLDDPILQAVIDVAADMDSLQGDYVVEPIERGIVLYEAARHAMHKARKEGRKGYMHSATYNDCIELTPELVPGDE